MVCHSARQQRLPGARRTIQDHPLRLSYAESLEEFGVLDRQLHKPGLFLGTNR
jgi:hypothetical protein